MMACVRVCERYTRLRACRAVLGPAAVASLVVVWARLRRQHGIGGGIAGAGELGEGLHVHGAVATATGAGGGQHHARHCRQYEHSSERRHRTGLTVVEARYWHPQKAEISFREIKWGGVFVSII